MKHLPAVALGFPMLLTLVTVSYLGYAKGKAASVLLFVASIILLLFSLIKYHTESKKVSVLPIISLFMCGLVALIYTAQLRQTQLTTAAYVDSEGYAEGEITDIAGFDGNYQYEITCDDGFKFMLNTSTRLSADMYDSFRGELIYAVASTINAELPVQSFGVENALYVTPTNKTGLKKAVHYVRQQAARCIDNLMPSQTGALVKGVLLGDERAFGFSLMQDFTVVGLAHIIVISGSHLSLFVVLMMMALPTGINRRRFAWIVIFPMIFYMMLCGMSAAVVRAGVCSAIFVLSFTLKRDVTPMNSLGASAMLVSLFWPQGAVSIGFLLSFFSTLGILLIYCPLREKIRHTAWPKLVKIILNLFVLTASAQLFITPFLVICYGKITPISILSNVLVGSAVGLLMMLGILLVFAMALLVTIPLSLPITGLMRALSAFCIGIVKGLSGLLDASVVVSQTETVIALCLLCIGGMLIVGAANRRHMLRVGAATVAVALFALSFCTYMASNRVVITSYSDECLLIRHKTHSVIIGHNFEKKENYYLSTGVYDSHSQAADLLDVHMSDVTDAMQMINSRSDRLVLTSERIITEEQPYVVARSGKRVVLDDDFTVTPYDNFTVVDVSGYRIAVAQSGADLTKIKNIDCIIARGNCKGQSRAWIVYENINALAIGGGRVYNVTDEVFKVTFDKNLLVMQ